MNSFDEVIFQALKQWIKPKNEDLMLLKMKH